MSDEITTAENIGPGTGLYNTKVGPQLQFNSITTTDNTLILSEYSDHINLAANIAVIADGLTDMEWQPTSPPTTVTGASASGTADDGQSLLVSPPISANTLSLKRILTTGELTESSNGNSVILGLSANVGILNTPQTRSAQLASGLNTLSINSGVVNWNLNSGNVAFVTLTNNVTIANPTNILPGGEYTLMIRQDGTGNRLVVWDTKYHWSNGSLPTLTTAPGSLDIIKFVSDGTSLYATIITYNIL